MLGFLNPALRERGHRVEAVELHRGTLAADTNAAQETVDSLGPQVVACGWSYGGMVIMAKNLPAGSHLVYLCAFMPDEGESASMPAERHPGDIATLFQVDEAGNLFLERDEVDEFAWADAPADRAAAARASLRPQAMQTFVDTRLECRGGAYRPHTSSEGRTAPSTRTSNERWQNGRRTSSSGTRATRRCCRDRI